MATRADTNRIDATVLVVDDDDDEFRAALAETLQEEGCDVVDARTGEAALALLDDAAKGRARAPDLESRTAPKRAQPSACRGDGPRSRAGRAARGADVCQRRCHVVDLASGGRAHHVGQGQNSDQTALLVEDR
jgi:CheY-like chemotaxis protein